MLRKTSLETGNVYHIFSKSIAGFKIFTRERNFLRIFDAVKYYQIENPPLSFSHFIRVDKSSKGVHLRKISNYPGNKQDKIVDIIAYCFMPTHIHLVLRQLKDSGISIFMSKVLNSYARYFNTLYKRKGPLWEGPFQNVLVESDEQLYHLTRYIHLNPVTACLVDKPEDWIFSSYREYLSISKEKICQYDDLFEIFPEEYKEFVEERKIEQRELAMLKKLMLD